MARIAFYTQAYNSEKYLRKCIESVLNQTFTDIKYYIADNGSTDETRNIIKEYANRDNRIEPIYIDINSPVGTYNECLKKIYNDNHEFLCILDSDDWYDVEFAKTMLNSIDETNADFAICASNFISEETGKCLGIRGYAETLILQNRDLSKCFHLMYKFYRTVWAKLYRISILKDRKIFISNEVDYGADTLFVLDYIKNVSNIILLNNTFHNYLVRKTSDSYVYRPNRLNYDIFLYERALEYLELINGNTNQNIMLLSIIYFNAVMDSVKMFANSNCSKSERVQGISNIFVNSVTNNIWKTMLSSPQHIKNEFELDKFIFLKKKEILDTAIKVIDNSYEKELFNILVFICPELNDFWDCNSVKYWVNDNVIINDFLVGNFEQVYDTLNKLPYNKKSKFCLNIELYLAIKLSKSKEEIAKCYEHCNESIEIKQIKFVYVNNSILNAVANSELLNIYPDIIYRILLENYENATYFLYDALNVEDDLETELLTALDDVLLYTSAITSQQDYFIYAKKVQAIIAINLRDDERFKCIIAELEEIVQDEQELTNIKNMYMKEELK